MIQNTKIELSGVPARFLKETSKLRNYFSQTCTRKRPFDGHLHSTNQLGSFNTIHRNLSPLQYQMSIPPGILSLYMQNTIN